MVGICLYARGWANLDSLRLGIRYLVTYSGAKFEVAMSNGLGGDEFTRNTLFDLCPCSQGHTKCCPVLSTSCDLFSYKGFE